MGRGEQKRNAEDRKIEKQGKRDVSWDSMMDGCIRRLKVDPRYTIFWGGKLRVLTQKYMMLYKISIFFDETQIYVICQN